MRYLTMITLSAVLLGGCTPSTPLPDPTVPLYGKWGGVGVELDLNPAESSLRFDCAAGTITEAIKPNANGNFTAKGTYTPRVGLPILDGKHPTPEPATYSGQLWGNSLNLRIRNAQGENFVNYYLYLEHGKPATLHRCL